MRYYRSTNETWTYKIADVYFEVDGMTVIRQVSHVDGRWLSSLDDHDPEVGPLLTDQPLHIGEDDEFEEISVADFDAVWAAALRQRPNGSV